ncbi:hypothetical protein PN462_12445 [Spirulina sp. CS-785/01]|uniref:hypothetical protein n=1 Tax=Spirulina sp. CS-785/01 TaxID=3021716 RepID=UPI00233153CF|nr:hypothetical protein [Spirulina sp. CS-785/01]MDB9313914.1 hypothetical protein [Spirulina sp. CS-785/01]
MTNPSPPEENLQNNPPEAENSLSLEFLQEEHLNLKQEVETLHEKQTKLRSLLQTLVSGLLIGILIMIGIAGWFAYNMLVQQQINRKEAKKAAETNAKLREQVEALEATLQRQQQQLEQIRQDFPDELKTLSETVQSQERQLDLLRDQVNLVEEPVDDEQ